MSVSFREFGKIPRWSREVVVTEKIDGTNACVVVHEDGETLAAQSRTRLITPEDDNYGFAAWVQENKEALRTLGPGHHFGEWWGRGVNRNYGLDHRRFSLFNVDRWTSKTMPSCCDVVPALWRGVVNSRDISVVLTSLAQLGSRAAPGFMDPEGIIVFHTKSGHLYKQTCKHDDEPKNAHVKKERVPQEKKPASPWFGGRRKGTGLTYAGTERRRIQ